MDGKLLPYDCSRCIGVSTDEGELVHPCNTCRRVLWAKPSGGMSPWFTQPPRKGNECPSHWPVEERMNRDQLERMERRNARDRCED